MKRSSKVVLWMLGAGLGVAILSEERTVEQLRRDQYRSREDCLRDWGGSEQACPPGNSSSGGGGGGGGGFYYSGPRYYWDRSTGRPVIVTESGEHQPATIARPAGTPGSHSMASAEAGTVSRGGFGHFGFRSGGG